MCDSPRTRCRQAQRGADKSKNISLLDLCCTNPTPFRDFGHCRDNSAEDSKTIVDGCHLSSRCDETFELVEKPKKLVTTCLEDEIFWSGIGFLRFGTFLSVLECLYVWQIQMFGSSVCATLSFCWLHVMELFVSKLLSTWRWRRFDSYSHVTALKKNIWLNSKKRNRK